MELIEVKQKLNTKLKEIFTIVYICIKYIDFCLQSNCSTSVHKNIQKNLKLIQKCSSYSYLPPMFSLPVTHFRRPFKTPLMKRHPLKPLIYDSCRIT